MNKPKFLKNILTGNIFCWSPELAKAPNMAACDAQGNVLAVEPVSAAFTPPAATAAESAGAPAGTDSAAPTMEDFKAALDAMNPDELKAKATELGVEFAANIGAEKLKGRILDAVEARLKEGAPAGDAQ